ncbi:MULTISPECIES: hypothetical protein [unclassified Dorea]|nr:MULTISPECIES: hypothetical protein [unclassified Dorea]
MSTELYENQIREAGTIIVEHYSSLLKEGWLRLLETNVSIDSV